MKQAQTTQEALNAALKEAQAWKAAALAAQAECEKQKLLVSELLSLDDFSSSYTLKAERDALVVMIKSLIKAIKAIENDCIECSYDDESGYFIGNDAISNACELAHYSTPQQQLAEIRAEAVLQFAGSVLAKYRYDITEWAKIEADKIRQGGDK